MYARFIFCVVCACGKSTKGRGFLWSVLLNGYQTLVVIMLLVRRVVHIYALGGSNTSVISFAAVLNVCGEK